MKILHWCNHRKSFSFSCFHHSVMSGSFSPKQVENRATTCRVERNCCKVLVKYPNFEPHNSFFTVQSRVHYIISLWQTYFLPIILHSVETILYSDTDEEFSIHDISFHWYTLIGVICVWLPGVSISYLTGGKDLRNFNYQVVSPWIHRWMPKKCLHTKLLSTCMVQDGVGKNNRLIQ